MKTYHDIKTGHTPFFKKPLIRPVSFLKYINKTDKDLDNSIKSSLSARKLYIHSDTLQGARSTAKKAFWDKYKVKNRAQARFKKSDETEGSFCWANSRTKIETMNDIKFLTLSRKLKRFKILWDRDLPDDSIIKSVRIKREVGGYYVIFAIQMPDIEEFKPLSNKEYSIVGMDTNNGHLDFSDKKVLKYLRIFTEKELESKVKKYSKKGKKSKASKKAYKQLRRKQKVRKLEQIQSKRQLVKSYGKNYKKTKRVLGKLKRKDRNIREHSLHKLSNEVLCKEFDFLIIEDLNIEKMVKKENKIDGMSKQSAKQMRKNILNFAYSSLHTKLFYKAPRYNKFVLAVNPEFTTQDCSNCRNNRQKLSLSDRVYLCPACGFKAPRDYNSSLNIRHKGVEILRAKHPLIRIAA